MVAGSRPVNGIGKIPHHLGVGEGQRYLRSRVMPVEGRSLASGELAKEERSGDWR